MNHQDHLLLLPPWLHVARLAWLALISASVIRFILALCCRIQDFVDRRFYRQKYDAERALAEFTVSARRETDLGRRATRMVETVQDTLQPQNASVWMKAPRKGESGKP